MKEIAKGPWAVGMRNGHNCGTVYARDGKDDHHDSAICMVYGIHHCCSIEEIGATNGAANAFLIAAAPDLLEALVMARYHVSMSGTGEDLAKVEAAIAKAKGEQA